MLIKIQSHALPLSTEIHMEAVLLAIATAIMAKTCMTATHTSIKAALAVVAPTEAG